MHETKIDLLDSQVAFINLRQKRFLFPAFTNPVLSNICTCVTDLCKHMKKR